MSGGFERVLEHIRSVASTEAQKGRLFERLMKAYFLEDPVYRDRFREVWLWSEWASRQAGFAGTDTGIDLVAEEADGGYCAIQCKCYQAGTRLQMSHLANFIAASAREPFSTRLFVDTGDDWGPNARRTVTGLKPACQVLRFDDLADRPVDWPDLVLSKPEDLAWRHEPYSLRPHQKAAFDDVAGEFERHDRGRLIMACGTGKTFTALRIAESMVGLGGRALYLVPSISLLQQSMREWAEQKAVPHRYIGICSDTRAGRNDEDAPIEELEIPVSTDPAAISAALRESSPHAMTVVFSTYHSLGILERAQKDGAPAFDLAICDEAHRTTGVDRPGDSTSPFVLVHDERRVRAARRLYMTATPRIYTQGAKSKASHHDVEVFSMDDDAVYGPEFHRLPFSRAVDQNLLADYKVVVFTLSEDRVDRAMQANLTKDGIEIPLSDRAKIVGCWEALQHPEGRTQSGGATPSGSSARRRLKRAIAFTNTIKASKRLEQHWEGVVEDAVGLLPEMARPGTFRCEVRHVDGQHNALERKQQIDWLKGDSLGACRILSNARCLSEGINVPALDAVLFMSSRNSQVDIVQAVGRAMRKAPGKEYGYIILPVTVPAGTDPARALNDNERFAAVWGVLRALRSHDDRFDAEINQIDLNRKPTERIIFSVDGTEQPEGGEAPTTGVLPFPPLELPPGAIYAKIVEKCGDRKYWETWAKDVADIFQRLKGRIANLLERRDNEALREWFDAFHAELRICINESVSRDNAVEMMAQHILTRPVFEALFERYDFAGNNPVARALDALRNDFGEFGLENETRDLDSFYESVRMRARGLDNSEARQRVLMELYEKFFATALKKEADRLGIVYTPVEVVDFILASADHALRREFGRGLSDAGVHVLDPFTGTGIFLVRLLQSGLIAERDLTRKYREELHANEIVLLAYYIAAVHIEEAFHGRRGADGGYEPFEGIVLTDTFNLHTERTAGFPKEWLPDNSERAERQQSMPIQVIVGNPPWSAWQRSSADANPNVDYPELERRVAETYAARSTAALKNSLYDTYKMAIRWASDRIGERGIVALVTNGSWIDGNVDSGVRACLAEEFSSIDVVNLRGNQRTQGDLSKREGGKVFGQGSRAPVAITILAKNPEAAHSGCRILYRDIGDYQSREDKLEALRAWGSIAGIEDWEAIAPDRHNDWVGQRDEAFRALYPLGTKSAKSGRSDEAVFRLFSNGFKTSRDPYLYSLSREACAANAKGVVDDYSGALALRAENAELSVESAANLFSTHVRWDRELKNNLRRGRSVAYSPDNIWQVHYRPFVKQHCYVDYALVSAKAQQDRIFPAADAENRAICVPGVGSTKPFSALVVDVMPDLELISKGQCFPRYRFHRTGGERDLTGIDSPPERVDNITDAALRAFQSHYRDNGISKDAIFEYVYGVLHAPEFRERFANDLAKGLPRIPFAPDFHAFAKAGRRLEEFHLGYETCPEHPLEVEFLAQGEPAREHFRIGSKAMRPDDKDDTVLAVNDHIRLVGIPKEAHEYKVNGRTPIDWFVDRYRFRTDDKSGIVNDPNGWFADPRDLIAAIRRVVHVSVETVAIVRSLPAPFPEA